MISISLHGTAAILKRMRKYSEAGRKASKMLMVERAEVILTKSKRIVPYEFGDLQDSGQTFKPTWSRISGWMVRIAYLSVYAAEQHNNLTFRHAAGRRALYLKEPLDQEQQQLAKRGAALLSRALKGVK